MKSDFLENIIIHATQLGHTLEIISSIKSGKEADVFVAQLNENLVAIKVYKHPEHRTFRNAKTYVLGKHYKKPSERKAMLKGNTFAKRLLHSNWGEREFFLLQKFSALGISVPKPVALFHNALCMEYLGNNNTVAPRLCDVVLNEEQYMFSFETIIKAMQMFWQEGIIHADLSPFNILWHNNSPYIIDFPQAVDIRNHPHADTLLERDLHTILHFFEKKIPIQNSFQDYKNLITGENSFRFSE